MTRTSGYLSCSGRKIVKVASDDNTFSILSRNGSNDSALKRKEQNPSFQALKHDWNECQYPHPHPHPQDSSFHMKQAIKRVWIKRGEKYYVSTVKHPVKIHVWGCFSKYGFGKLILFKQTLNSEFMCKIYKNGLLPSVNKWFGDNSCDWKLLEVLFFLKIIKFNVLEDLL
ncbi:hypothetical protein I4U23_011287 [Adineta vaga]|nr:hypothetical protein I4U23_011287 [Adineta vaga]